MSQVKSLRDIKKAYQKKYGTRFRKLYFKDRYEISIFPFFKLTYVFYNCDYESGARIIVQVGWLKHWWTFSFLLGDLW